MPWYVALFWLISVILTGASWRWGGWAEKVVSSTNLAGAVATRILTSPSDVSFRTVERGILIIDILVFAAFMFVALRSDRWWPLCATALLAPEMFAHLAKVLSPSLDRGGYALAGLTSYAMLIPLTMGVIKQWRYRARVI
jgi:hypothetical protein